MIPPTNPQQVLELARQNGLLRAGQMQALGIGRVVLTRLTASGELERVGRGVYRLPGIRVKPAGLTERRQNSRSSYRCRSASCRWCRTRITSRWSV